MEYRKRTSDLALEVKALQQDVADLQERLAKLEQEGKGNREGTDVAAITGFDTRTGEML